MAALVGEIGGSRRRVMNAAAEVVGKRRVLKSVLDRVGDSAVELGTLFILDQYLRFVFSLEQLHDEGGVQDLDDRAQQAAGHDVA